MKVQLDCELDATEVNNSVINLQNALRLEMQCQLDKIPAEENDMERGWLKGTEILDELETVFETTSRHHENTRHVTRKVTFCYTSMARSFESSLLLEDHVSRLLSRVSRLLSELF